MTAEPQKRRLQRLSVMYVRSPIYFVTACTHSRRELLANGYLHESSVRFARTGAERGAWIGDYVLMPDHLHAFVATDDRRGFVASTNLSTKAMPAFAGRSVLSTLNYSATLVWSWTICQPSGVFLNTSVNRPWGRSLERSSCHRPNASAPS